MTEEAAYQEALIQKGIPFEEANRTGTYRVYVKQDKTATDTSKVLIDIPSKELLLMLQDKAILEQLADQGNETAKIQLEELKAKLEFYTTIFVDTQRSLDFIKSVRNIKEVDANVIMKEHLQTVIEASEKDLIEGISALEQKLDELY